VTGHDGDTVPPPHRIDVVIVAPPGDDVDELEVALAAQRLRVRRTQEPEAVARAVVGGQPDVVLVDLRDESGVAERMLTWVCQNATASAIAISDIDDIDSRLWALRLGVIDQVVAPFATREAVLRTELAIGRRRAVRTTRLQAGDLAVDVSQRCAFRNNETIPLTPREIGLLQVLIQHGGVAVAKRQLLDAVWGTEARTENVVEAHISALRRKLHSTGEPVIHTVHGYGYVLRPVPSTKGQVRDELIATRDRLIRERGQIIARRDEILGRSLPISKDSGPSGP
jgi:DNA-binding response OmpR family regulator